MNEPTLRPALASDLPFVYRGELAYIRQWEPAHEDDWYRQLERHLTRWVEHLEHLTIATLEGQPVGYSLWMPDEGHAELCTLGVCAAFRRKGVGDALLQAYIAAARAEGFSHLTLNVRQDNPARRLYERAGFRHLGTSPNGYLRHMLQAAPCKAHG